MLINNTTRIALQTAVAIFVTEILCYFFNVQRGYWATLTAMTLISQTWGESIKRSLERVSMTILGGVTGSILYFILPPSPTLIGIFLFAFIFLSLLFTVRSQLLSIFAMTGFVVFLFAIISNWNTALLKARIFDTVLGASVSLVVSYFFFSIKPNKNELMKNYFEALKEGYSSFLQNPDSQLLLTEKIIIELELLIKKSIFLSYTYFLQYESNKRFKLLINFLRIISHQIQALMILYSAYSDQLNSELKSSLMTEMRIIEENLSRLIERLSGKDMPALIVIEEPQMPQLSETSPNQLIALHITFILYKINQTLVDYQNIGFKA